MQSFQPNRAYGGPVFNGLIKEQPEDFFVREELGFEPAGDGDHLYLWIEKKGMNTLAVREKLAQIAHLPPVNIGYSGLKDKKAITQQWFSLKPKKNSNIDKELEGFEFNEKFPGNEQSFRILKILKHNKKLKIGSHRGNYFEVNIKRCFPISSAYSASQAIEQKKEVIQCIEQQGFPNYFGNQRFGYNFNNIDKAIKLFDGKIKPSKEKRSLYLSAARSFLFNALLNERVIQNNWNQYIVDDHLILNGSNSFFSIDTNNKEDIENIHRRIKEKDIHIAGILPGYSDANEIRGIEHNVFNQFPKLYKPLIESDIKLTRRPLRGTVKNLTTTVDDDVMSFKFSLPKGSYATVFLSELFNIVEG